MKLKLDEEDDLVGEGIFMLWSYAEYVHISDLTPDVNRQAVYQDKYPKKLMTNNSFLSAYKDCLVARCKV